MMPSRKEYHLLPEEERQDGCAASGGSNLARSKDFCAGHKSTFAIFASLLFITNLCSLILPFYILSPATTCHTRSSSPYAGLSRDVPIVLDYNTTFAESNQTRAMRRWKAINIDPGLVALPDSYAWEKNLPLAARFPWDQSKGLYILEGYHNLHCVKTIYIGLTEMRDKQPLSRAFDHLVHCLDILRQEIMCTAADTPIAGKAAGGLGTNPTRLCRSWDALEAFAQQYNACYSFANESASAADLPRIERFRYCPPDSPYRAAMEAVFGPSLFPGEDTEE